ncbi:MAG: thiamine-phosphate kinase [Fimbriimonadales bacterium]|nr:MAG: thiamine-monophosphate kinase [Fimbriimonadales bacterium]
MRLDAPAGGEGALIARIALRAGHIDLPAPYQLLQGIGDDTAVLQVGDQTLLWTTDMLVEGVHFRLDWTDAAALGWKALAVNLSDLAAMGGEPVGVLLSLALPPEYTEGWLDAFVEGFAACAQSFGVALLGGDTNRAERMVIDVSALGAVQGAPVLRSGARAGDWLLVSGGLGGSRAGLEALQAGEASEVDLTPHFRPQPRLQVGAQARALGATAMMDISDGLAADLPKLLRASGVGAVVCAAHIPVHPVAAQWAHRRGLDPLAFAIAGGEDYELLIAAPPPVAQQLLERVPAETGVPLTRIGEVHAAQELWLEYPDGRRESFAIAGWDHFRA